MIRLTIHGSDYRIADGWDMFRLGDYTVTRLHAAQFTFRGRNGRAWRVRGRFC